MTEQFLPFALPDVGDAEVEAVAEAIRSGWLSSGPRVKEFEHRFRTFVRPDGAAVAVNSATAGLHLALEALGIGPGDEVLVPTWTFTATAEVVRYVGAVPVFVDVDKENLNIDLTRAAALVTPRTKAVMPVHFAGLPVDPRALRAFARRHDLLVIEDAAHAFPAGTRGTLVGASDSDAVVFSFYATKTITTGEGGMVVTPHLEVAERIRVMRLHGINRDAFDRYRADKPSWHYDVVAPGYKYNLTDPAAAMGLIQLDRAEQMRKRREEIAEAYSAGLATLPVAQPAWPSGDILHSWHLYVIRVPADLRDTFIHRMSQAGIGCSVHFIPLHLQPYWRDFGRLRPESFPVATTAFATAVSLPIYSAMSDRDVDRVIAAAQAILT